MPTSDWPHTAGVPPATASVELPKIPVAEAIALMMALLVAVFAFQFTYIEDHGGGTGDH